MNRFQRLLTAATCALVLAGCGSTVKLDESNGAPIEGRDAAAAAGQGAGGADASAAGSRQVAPVTASDTKDPLSDPASPLSKRSIYFDFDSYTVRDEYRGTIQAHGSFLIANKGRRVVIQGNADERGSREYNLALGQKRAEAVRKALSAVGVPEGQVEAVSFGEEKPRATGSDEASWAENRRADLVYQ
jgi:peptidoglycan-associated lipoprotein